MASLRGHVGVVGLLLSRSTSLLKIADSKGQTCLHVASANGHYEMVQALLGQGSDQTMVDKVRANFSSKKEKNASFLVFCVSFNIKVRFTY